MFSVAATGDRKIVLFVKPSMLTRMGYGFEQFRVNLLPTKVRDYYSSTHNSLSSSHMLSPCFPETPVPAFHSRHLLILIGDCFHKFTVSNLSLGFQLRGR